MNLKEYIPFEGKEFRPYQKGAINDIIESIEDGNKFTILNAPVGSGKALIGYVVARYLYDLGFHHSYLCTSTKLLQDQYINDFKDVKTIRGRGNFDCITEPLFDCSKGMCQTHANFSCDWKPLLKDQWEYDHNILPIQPVEFDGKMLFYGDKEFDEAFLFSMCEYWKQKISGIMSPITMLNYDYLISDTRFAQHLPHRKFLVCDEGHNIEKILMRNLETVFSPSTVKKDVGFEFKYSNTIKGWAEQMQVVAGLYKDKMKMASDKKKLKLQEKYEKFSILEYLLDKDPENWVFIQEKKYDHLLYSFKPIMVSNYTNMIFNTAEHILIMTGTILKQDIFARDLGIRDFSYIEIPSIIQPKQRPIIKMYVGSMATSSVDFTMPNMIAKIKILADKHKDEKGVIHTFTYNIARKFQKALKKNNRFMFHNQKDKDKVFERFKKNDTNKILVSPVAYEGIDFPYDQARWQCICKEPFPNMRDPQVSVRDSVDYDWVFRQRCLVLSQMYGRTNRAPDDYSVTYLLDSRIESLLGPATLVTDYFLEALENMRYNDKLILTEDAYDKLTKDNSRKTHEFDRIVETHILQDIQDGYDTLHSLRSAYKKFSSDAYKEIIPAVNRLLKHDALRYE